jgi:hypothetical protein
MLAFPLSEVVVHTQYGYDCHRTGRLKLLLASGLQLRGEQLAGVGEVITVIGS